MKWFSREYFETTLEWTRRLFIPFALCFLAYSAYKSIDQLGTLVVGLSAWHLAGAWICWSMAQWIGPVATAALSRILELPFGYRELAFISVLRIPARYLPGGIWQSVARFAAYAGMDINKSDAITILVVEHLMALGMSVVIGSLLILWSDGVHALRLGAPLLLAVAVILLFATSWWATRRIDETRMRLRAILSLAASVALFWVFATASFCLYWTAIYHSSYSEIPRIASIYLLSWAAGFLAPFAPQGLGVFEWVASKLLSTGHQSNLSVTVLAGFRLIVLVSDLSVWAAAMAYTQLRGVTQRSA